MPRDVRLNVYVTEDMRQRFRIKCLQKKTTMTKVLLYLIEKWLKEK